MPRGHALGMVQQLANDDLMYTREELLAGLDVAMGGRAAEELIFGPNKVSFGPNKQARGGGGRGGTHFLF